MGLVFKVKEVTELAISKKENTIKVLSQIIPIIPREDKVIAKLS